MPTHGNFRRVEHEMVDASAGNVANAVTKTLNDGGKRDINVEDGVELVTLVE